MKKPVLVVMAAGMGSRYGGLKQIDPVDPYGNMIIDFSIYDAKQAGFEKVIFIIKKANENTCKKDCKLYPCFRGIDNCKINLALTCVKFKKR